MSNDTDNPNWETNPEAYLEKLRREMARDVLIAHDREGGVIFGFRCWGDRGIDAIRDAMLDGLARWTARFETFAFLIDRDAEAGDRRAWTEAWRVADRTLVRQGPFEDVVAAVGYRQTPRERG